MDLKLYILIRINVKSSSSMLNKKVMLERKFEEAVKMYPINLCLLYCEL